MNVTLTEILDLVDSAAELEELMIGATSIIAMFIACNDDDAPTFTFLYDEFNHMAGKATALRESIQALKKDTVEKD